ncbi:MAG: NAD(P)H-dependent oxidoreductase subunit E [Gammaproteobacteria bacterium]|nr:NAD(P)H-dependent oxidoreductase subunit E [Gammaproteobacteria bacterium]MDE0246764.1 NAD(P)H-dependent oxidoreductase subunit E [Gammaproteobacteria bacterium]
MSNSHLEVREGEAPFRNPGWAGNTGEFELTEADVRGDEYVGILLPDGGHPGAAPALPYILADKDPDAPLFEGPYRERIEKILSRYPTAQAALIPVLNMAHELRGHISDETMATVADTLGLPHAYVRGVTSFYTMYNRRPVGRFLIQVCTNISCNLCGGEEVLAAFLAETGTELGETSPDNLFTVTEVECLAACGFPAAVQINSRYFENVTVEDVPPILEHLKGKAG